MNIEYAKTLAMSIILGKIGLQPAHENVPLFIYPTPFLKDAPLTLHVNSQSNTWFDSELQIGGNCMDFIREYLKRLELHCSIVDVLQWLEFNIGYPSLLESISLPDYQAIDKQYLFSYKSTHISHVMAGYLTRRRIPIALAKKHLKEIAYINTLNGKERLALGLKNEEGGYAIRSCCIKAIIGPRNISVIRGKAKIKTAVHVFKDIYDYMSAVLVQGGKQFNNDTIILNTYSCLEHSASYIRKMQYRKVYTWLDNGEIGKQATKNYTAFCAALENTQHKPMNHLYTSSYDANSWLVQQAQKIGK